MRLMLFLLASLFGWAAACGSRSGELPPFDRDAGANGDGGAGGSGGSGGAP